MWVLSHFSHVRLSVTPWTVPHQAPLSMGFCRQDYSSGLPCPPPGDLPNPRTELRSPALKADSLSSEPPGNQVVMCGCESWLIKKAECWRIDAFELWRRLLRVPWTARRSYQPIFATLRTTACPAFLSLTVCWSLPVRWQRARYNSATEQQQQLLYCLPD